MTEEDYHESAVDALQSLGLKQYEAECFVALTRLPNGTAKAVSDVADVPRTRVYDAMRELADRGLVETRNTRPREYRAVPIEDAVETFRERYASKTSSLHEALEAVESTGESDDSDDVEVWSIAGTDSVDRRVRRQIENADDEIALAVSRERLVTDRVLDAAAARAESGVDVSVAAGSRRAAAAIRSAVPEASVIEPDAAWLDADESAAPSIGRLVSVDGDVVLVSGLQFRPASDELVETAVSGRGAANGLVLLGDAVLSSLFDDAR